MVAPLMLNRMWFVMVLCACGVTEAGIFPSLPSLPSISIPNPFSGARGSYFQLGFDKFVSFWIDLPKQAANLFTKVVPQTIKNILNYDPAPDWVPDPNEFEEESSTEFNNTEHLTAESSENHPHQSRSIKIDNSVKNYTNDDDNKLKNEIPHEEKGNLHGIAREVIRSLTDSFSNTSTGLDTDQNFFTGLLNEFKDKVKAIYPGTQWCGDGNVARSKKHLGFFRNTDKCCREHDSCPDYIERNEMKYDLFNKGLFTRSHCDCDQKFYNCLKESNDMIASQIGTAYFTVLGPQCFKKDYPILHCRIKFGLTNRCVDYELDNSTEKIYQWFDNPEF